MKLFDRLKIALNEKSWDRYVRDFITGADLGSTSSYHVSGESAMRFSAVWACIRVLAETMASIPVFEYRKTGDDSREKTDSTGLYDVLHSVPNDEMNSYNWHEAMMASLSIGGNAVCDRLLNRVGEVVGLYPYEWSRVEIDRDEKTKRLRYTVDGNREKSRSREQVFHITGLSLDGAIGLSPVEYASKSIGLGLTYEQYVTNFFKNGAIPSGVFEHPQFLKPEAFNRLKENIQKNYGGLMNAGTPMILEDGMKFSQLTMKLADAQLLESKKFQIEDVCRIYRVPLHLVQNLDKATNNNIEHQSLEFVMYTMLPWVRRFESAINAQLLTRKMREAGYYFEYNISALLRGDTKSMAEAFAQGRQWGWLSVNDIRRLLNMNAVENGDIYLQPMNMVEAGSEPVDKAPSARLVEEMYKLIEAKNANT